jgi:hypothetical protein
MEHYRFRNSKDVKLKNCTDNIFYYLFFHNAYYLHTTDIWRIAWIADVQCSNCEMKTRDRVPLSLTFPKKYKFP